MTTSTHTHISHPTPTEFQIRRASDTNGMAVAGFVNALAAWVLLIAGPLSFICWVLGVVFSGIGLHRAMNEGRGRKGLAIAGLALSLGPVAVFMVAVAFIAA